MSSLPLEYRELNLIEKNSNQIGNFLKRDYAFIKDPTKPVRFCALMDATKVFLDKIDIISKYGKWY